MTPSHIRDIRRSLLRWYAVHRRPFPWRRTRDPYRILLSETMLQQTQASRAADHFRRWLRRFPTVAHVARAPQADVLRAWSGLGYNSRALRFHALTRIIAARRPVRFPAAPDALRELPGVGRYTAHAVACFAFGAAVPVVDVNVRRIVSRLTRRPDRTGAYVPEEEAWRIAERLLPPRRAYDWNQALMDLGATVCTARRPRCGECPLSPRCPSAFSPQLAEPVKRAPKREPMWRGVPRRLHRGRLLTLLHGGPASAPQLASGLWNDAVRKDVEWVEELLGRMCAEGLLRKERTHYRVA